MNSLKRAYTYLDEDVLLRQYSKIAKRWEDSGRNVYHLSSAIGIPSLLVPLCINQVANRLLDVKVLYENYLDPIAVSLWPIPAATDVSRNIDGCKGLIEETSDPDARTTKDQLIRVESKVSKVARLPMFLAGVSLLGEFGYNIYSYFEHGEPMGAEVMYRLAYGLSELGIASSMYLKDRDPRLLQKTPAWRRAYQSSRVKLKDLAGRIGDWIPQPYPEPAPVRYETIEERVS